MATTQGDPEVGWTWQQQFIHDSREKSATALVWHCVALRAGELSQLWSIDPLCTGFITKQVGDFLGHQVRLKGVVAPN